MTNEDKKLLLRDICARLPYGVKVENTSFLELQIQTLFGRVSDDEFLMLETYKSVGGEDYRRITEDVHYTGYLESIKPYLRPMSSMTEDEKQEMHRLLSPTGTAIYENTGIATPVSHFGDFVPYEYMARVLNWLNAHHFDYNGLIEKGLALEATENMYK